MREPPALPGWGLTLVLAATIAVSSVLFTSLTMPAHAETAVASESGDLTQLSLEDLMNLEVTTVAKKAEKLTESAAAVYVVTAEDIRRSGVTNIADALRMVPGMHVASTNAHTWAISSRGFNDRFANKMLVLIDGRSVYTPLFSGTWWDAQDTLLDDVDRIEVIRGPGATMWGANAVNGVINIVTKKATDSHGLLFTSDSGSADKVMGALRFGGRSGATGDYRVYARYFDRNNFVDALGDDADDQWGQSRVGFRMDRDLSDTDCVTFQGDTYTGYGSQRLRENLYVSPYQPPVVDDYSYSGTNVLARWTRTRSEDSESSLQFYMDRTNRDDLQHVESRTTWDLDFQKRDALSPRRQLVWGFGYRLTSDDTDNTTYVEFDPLKRTDQLLSGFVQMDQTLVDRKLRLTVGSKVEHNDYTGIEIQPSARLLWTLDGNHTLWAAASRAVRTPNRGEADAIITLRVLPPGPEHLPYAVKFVGSEDFGSEKLDAYELGYRFQPSRRLSVDLATFYNVYQDLRTLEPETPYVSMTPVPNIVVPFRWGNLGEAHNFGVELSSNWQVNKSWKMALGYTWHKMNVELEESSHDTYTRNASISSPRSEINLRSYLDLSDSFALDTMAYYVSAIPAHHVPGYVRLDMRLGWRSSEDTEFSFVVQNLLDSQHQEYGGTLSELPMEVPRTMYLKLTRKY